MDLFIGERHFNRQRTARAPLTEMRARRAAPPRTERSRCAWHRKGQLHPQAGVIVAQDQPQAVTLDAASSKAAELNFLIGQTAQDNGQPEVAAEYYMRAFDIDPHHTQAIRRLAHLRLEQQRYDEALEFFQCLTDIDPSDAVAHGNMGIVFLYLGRNDEALERFDHALSLDPALESAQVNRKAVLKAMEGNVE